jgi:hypothetical protein
MPTFVDHRQVEHVRAFSLWGRADVQIGKYGKLFFEFGGEEHVIGQADLRYDNGVSIDGNGVNLLGVVGGRKEGAALHSWFVECFMKPLMRAGAMPCKLSSAVETGESHWAQISGRSPDSLQTTRGALEPKQGQGTNECAIILSLPWQIAEKTVKCSELRHVRIRCFLSLGIYTIQSSDVMLSISKGSSRLASDIRTLHLGLKPDLGRRLLAASTTVQERKHVGRSGLNIL